jgi:ATP-dependent RNA helicase RhlE
MSFDTLGLSPAILRALSDLGYETPTQVQTEAIPLILAGRDVLAGSQTGTGKTAAFTLPLLQRLLLPLHRLLLRLLQKHQRRRNNQLHFDKKNPDRNVGVFCFQFSCFLIFYVLLS